ncbi:MAG: winged helix-turn-helix domain-containing protein [Desulfobacterales bacterium]|nr:winged helix-turn-helix domain-containing protein [Desulfobacterales bacterium]
MSNEMKQIEVGSKVIVMVGCREIEATVLETAEAGCIVKSNTSGKEFTTKRILRIVENETPEDTSKEVEQADQMPDATDEVTAEPAAESETPNPAPESAAPVKPVKKMSLMDAAVEVLKTSEQPLNTREMVKAATERGYWIPTSCKTPEQTLYGSIFREIATKENPRIVKSEQRGKFQLA